MHDVRELAGGSELGLGDQQAALDGSSVVGAAADQARRSVSSEGGLMKMRTASGIVSLDLARALDLDLQDDRRAVGRALLELGAQRAVTAT